jgi:flagellar biosynthetic protein FlhB
VGNREQVKIVSKPTEDHRFITLDLQFFAQEKTEKATPKKRQDSRKKGQVAKSNEVPTALIMLFVFLLLFFIGSWLKDQFVHIFHMGYYEFFHWEITVDTVSSLFQIMTWEATKIVAPIMTIALVAGVFANYLQVGFLIATDPLKMKFERINPIQGIKRIFSLRAVVEFLKSIFKISFISFVVAIILWAHLSEIFLLAQKNAANALQLIGSITFQVGLIVAIILLFLSILDYLYQRYEFEKSIRMSKHDIKDEHKRTEGDPLIRSKIKERQRQMAMRRMMQEIPKADVVITNPTHYAVAIQYNQDEMEAPRVVAKGVDFVALKIKEIAQQHDVVVMENKPLARALYQQVEIGDAVPEELYKAVAEVLAYVYRIKGKLS